LNGLPIDFLFGGNMIKKWWKECVVYQVYLKSFMDVNNDGIGDIRGLILKLDYLKDLGVDVIWLNPFYQSPMADNGYDISDYDKVNPMFGTMADIEELLEEVHKRDMKIIADLVVNHTSDLHSWFIESKKSKDNPYRDYYYWRKGKDGKEPNNWSAAFTPSAWSYDPLTDEYYLHSFLQSMPDLNWECENLRKEIFAMMNRWLDKGFDGFRMDVINMIKKPEDFPDAVTIDNEQGYCYDSHLVFNVEGILDFYQKMHAAVLENRDLMTVGEMPETQPEKIIEYTKTENKALDMAFNFDISGTYGNLSVPELRSILKKWSKVGEEGGWNANYLSNHDLPRQVSVYGNDKEFWLPSAKLLAVLIHTQQGTPYIYQGEEIGMTNARFDRIENYADVQAIYRYNDSLAAGKSSQEAIESIKDKSRDNARTPFQWNSDNHAGFTKGNPWLKVNEDYRTINAQDQIKDPNSIYNFYKELIRLRKQHSTLIYGNTEFVLSEYEQIIAYRRFDENESFNVLLNFSDQSVEIEYNCTNQQLVQNNIESFKVNDQTITLRPWQAVILKKGKENNGI
jgi:oligo-1,6-glucosidase